MPSIFTTLKLIIQGKPVYDTTSPPLAGTPTDPAAPPPTAETPGQPESTIQKNNPSTFPVVYISRTQSRLNGQMMQIYCSIKNNWNDHIDVDRIHILGTERRLEISLSAGQEREVLVYEGPLLAQQGESEALLEYKTETGDYFEAVHEVHYMYMPEKIYEVSALSLHLPIRDVYG